MPARDTSKADANTPPDDGAPTTSTSATDASASTGAAAGDAVSTTTAKPPAETSAPAPADQPEPVSTIAPASQTPDPTRVVIEQAPAEPQVFYGEDALVPGSGSATDPNRPHVKADYKPFEW